MTGAADNRLIHWKAAVEACLRPVRVLNARVEEHRQGGVFFVQHLVDYDNGQRGWRRSTGKTRLGREYTEKYQSRDAAEASVQFIKDNATLDGAVEIMKTRAGAVVCPDTTRNLEEVLQGTPRDDRKNLTPEKLIATLDQQDPVVDMVLAHLQGTGVEIPSRHSLQFSYRSGRRTFEALLGCDYVQKAVRDLLVQQAIQTVVARGTEVPEFGAKNSIYRFIEYSHVGLTAVQLADLYAEQENAIEEAVMQIDGGPPNPTEHDLLRSEFGRGMRSAAKLKSYLECTRADRRRREEKDDLHRQRCSAARELQARKEAEAEERRIREHAFLRAKAAEKAAADGVTAPGRDNLSFEGEEMQATADRVLDMIASAQDDRPYLRHVGSSGGSGLWISEDGRTWREWGRYEKWQRKRDIAERAEMTDAFGLDPMEHWGRVKGQLLRMLKPGELSLLHRQDVQCALDEARRVGRHLVVIRNFAFLWIEEEGRWEARDTVRRSGRNGQGDRLWAAGPIMSWNYGRIIVLPYIKADGIEVHGHTKNPPHEGAAEPRTTVRMIQFAVYDEIGRDDTWDHYGNTMVPEAELVSG